MDQDLTPLDQQLLAQLKSLLSHVASLDGNANPSPTFCSGCERNRGIECPTVKIRQMIDYIEKGNYDFELRLEAAEAENARLKEAAEFGL